MTETTPSVKLLLVGSTGLVGHQVLELALADPRVSKVLVLTRRPVPFQHVKLQTRQVDFDQLPADPEVWRADAVICTLGTTMRAAGSQAAFQRVDHTYPLAVARHARQHGTPTYVLNSALGADPASRIFYNRVKGELERDLMSLDFPSLTLVRPGLIGGVRSEFRLGERGLLMALRLLGPLLPRRWRINPAPHIASALLDAAIHPQAGVGVVTSEQLA